MRHAKRLQVGVGDNELDALHAGIDHAVDCVAAASTYADDFDLGVVAGLFVEADANAESFFMFSILMLKCETLTTKGTKVHEGIFSDFFV